MSFIFILRLTACSISFKNEYYKNVYNRDYVLMNKNTNIKLNLYLSKKLKLFKALLNLPFKIKENSIINAFIS